MKSLKKVLAILVVAMMILASVSALADTTVQDGKGAAGAAVTTDNSLKIFKSVVVENPTANITVGHPEMEFSYTVAPKTPVANATVTDEQNQTSTVVKGVEGGVTLSDNGVVTIPAGTIALNKNGQEIVSGALTVNVNLDAFSAPGIYRYAITDTTEEAALTNPGVVRSADLDKEYILDVYLTWVEEVPGTPGEDGQPGTPAIPGHPAVAGYVLTHEEVEHIDGETEKDSGFDKVTIVTENVPGTPGTPDTPGTDPIDPTKPTDPIYGRKLDDSTKADLEGNDFYYTYNATLTKKVTGGMGDHNNAFEFDLAVTNKTTGGADVIYFVNGRTSKTQADADIAAETANVTKAFAKDGDTVTIYGLNPNATVNYTETNNAEFTYTYVKVTDKANEELKNVKSVAVGGTVKAYDADQKIATYAKDAKAADLAANAITYENNLEQVSPTGVVLRVAPYLAMLAAGLVIVMLARRKHNED